MWRLVLNTFFAHGSDWGGRLFSIHRPFTTILLFAVGLLLIQCICGRLPPKITNLENGDNFISLRQGMMLVLNCEGEQKVTWRAQEKSSADKRGSEETIELSSSLNRYRSMFSISDTVYTDTGKFTCHYEDKIESEFPEDKTDVYVFINDPDHLLLPLPNPAVIPVHQSTETVIPCLPTSLKVNVTLWKGSISSAEQVLENGLEVTFDPTRGFVILFATIFYSGEFLCRANLNEKFEQRILYLHYLASTDVVPSPFIDTKSKYAVLNADYTLICSVKAPTDVFLFLEWTFPEERESARYKIGPETSNEISFGSGGKYRESRLPLTISSVQTSDQGTFTCTVKDHTGKSNSKSVFVEVKNAGETSIRLSMGGFDPNEAFEYPVGFREVKFVVAVESFPPNPQLNWYKHDTLLSNSAKFRMRHTDKSSTLSIYNLERKDTGIYTLVGSIGDKQDDLSLTLVIIERPEVSIRPTPMMHRVGEEFHISCHVEGCPASNVTWDWSPCRRPTDCTRLFHQLDGPEENKEMVTESGEFFDGCHVQSILSGKVARAGFYRCSAVNDLGFNSSEAPLYIKDYSDKFGTITSDQWPFEKDSLTMQCYASVFYYSRLQWLWSPRGSVNRLLVSNTSSVMASPSATTYSLILNVRVNPVVMDNSGLYICQAKPHNSSIWEERQTSINVKKPQMPVIYETNLNGSQYTAYKEGNFEFVCRANGLPPPNITWLLNGSLIVINDSSAMQFLDNGQRLYISRVLPSDSGQYVCQANNRAGILFRNASLVVMDSEKATGLSKGGLAAVLIVVLLFFIFAVVFGIAYGRKVCRERKEKREIEQIEHMLFNRGDLGHYNPDLPLDEQIDVLPYDKTWEFPKEKLKLGRTIGQGAFGRVVRAEAQGIIPGQEYTQVAVKMLKERANNEQRKALMQELKIMIHLGRHINVVNLLGAVTQNLHRGELQVIVEYCHFGNLRHYLLRHRDNFVNQINQLSGEIDRNICDRISKNAFARGSTRFSEHYTGSNSVSASATDTDNILSTNGSSSGAIPLSPVSFTSDSMGNPDRHFSVNSKQKATNPLTTYNLVCYTYQICCGMQYLASKKMVHRDLALRNVLLAEGDIVKICDFGLTKEMYDKAYYRKKGQGPLPVKWMAIESISDRVFTTESDVWSYGIVLWEIFTLGGNPYPGLEVDEEFYKKISNGYRMEKPQFSTDSLYYLMLECWNHQSRKRPSFDDINATLANILDKNSIEHFQNLNDEYVHLGSHCPVSPLADYVNVDADGNPLTQRNSAVTNLRISPEKGSVNYVNVCSPTPGANGAPRAFSYGERTPNIHEVQPMMPGVPLDDTYYRNPPSPKPLQDGAKDSRYPNPVHPPQPSPSTNPFSTDEGMKGYLDMGSKHSLDLIDPEVKIRQPQDMREA